MEILQQEHGFSAHGGQYERTYMIEEISHEDGIGAYVKITVIPSRKCTGRYSRGEKFVHFMNYDANEDGGLDADVEGWN